jgi:hypothetical protein
LRSPDSSAACNEVIAVCDNFGQALFYPDADKTDADLGL